MAPYLNKTANEQIFKEQLVNQEQKKQIQTVKHNKNLQLKELRYEKPFQIKGSSHSKKRSQNHSTEDGPEHHYQLADVMTAENMNIPKFKRVNIRPLMTLNPIDRD